ncbi:MAG: sigma-70 family RNA polymerase sigma factor, partial [Phycisphaerales bacterium]
LVHEAYLRLVGSEDQNWSGRYHFFSAAAEAMRRILIENARRKKSLKHGGGRRRIGFDEAILAYEQGDMSADDLIALDEALEKLSKEDPPKADLVKLRYFAGMTSDQAAKILGMSPATADRDWAYARSWLRLEITGADQADQG